MRYLSASFPKLTASTLGLLSCLVVTTAAQDARADHECSSYEGPFVSTTYSPPECTSPVGLCTRGQLGGSFPSTYDFTFLTLALAPTSEHPTRFVYTGQSTITTNRGLIYGQDTGYLDDNLDGTATFVTTVNIVNGTRRYRQRSGQFVASGTLSFITGEAVGSYTASICHEHQASVDDDHDSCRD